MPDWRRYVRNNLRLEHAEPAQEAEAIEEIARQLEDAYLELLSEGCSPAEAEEQAKLHIQDWNVLAAALRSSPRYMHRAGAGENEWRPNMGPSQWIDNLARNFRYAGRRLWKTPGFTLLAVLTLAIGIGANTAIFSTINALLLRPVGSVNPDRLVGVGVNYDKLNIKSPTVSPTVFADVRDSKDIFEVAAMATSGDFNFNGSGLPERLQGQLVTWQWFDVFGARPILGRSFRPEEDQPNTNRVVVLDYRAWRSLFGGDVSIIGRSIQLNQEPYEVVGVMEPGFRRSNVLLWSPLGLPAEAFAPRNRFNESFETYARLKPGVSFEQAQAFVGVLNERVYENPRAAAFAKQNGWSMRLIRYTDYIAGDLKAPMFVLMGAVGFVFLIACSNIAGLMLARMSLRRREVAVQIAFGASRWQLIQQTLSEALFIMAGGSILGVGLAYAGIQALLALAPAAVSEGLVVTLDATVIAFLLLVSLIAGVLFGIAPAWHVSRTGTYESLKDGARGGTAGRAQLRLRSGLVMLEVALALLLLIGAGLFARSFARLQQVDIGFESAGVMSGFATLPQGPYKAADKQIAFYRAAIERLANLPGVSSAAAAIPLPFGGQAGGAFNIEGVPPEPTAPVPQGSVRWISPAFFSTIQIPIKRGRTFTDQDVPGSLPVVVIDEKLARQYWPNEDPIGKRIRRTISNASWLTIVGIVGSIRQSDLAVESTRGAYYLPMYQQPQPFLTTAFLVKTDSDPLQLSNPIREAVRSIDPAQPVANLKPMDEVVMATLGPRRFAVVLLTSFAAIALFMAALGLYAVISYSVWLRRQEMGIRMALGAQRSEVLSLVIRQGMRMAFVGMLAGIVAAVALGRVVTNQLFQVSTFDPLTLSLMSVLLLIVAFFASFIPARRVTKVDPLEACRYE